MSEEEVILVNRNQDIFSDIIFKATTKGNEKIPQNCSTIDYLTIKGESMILWCIDSKKGIPVDWTMKTIGKIKLKRCSSITDMSCFQGNDSPKTIESPDVIQKMKDYKSEKDLNDAITRDTSLKAHDKYLESIKFKANIEAMIFSKKPRTYDQAIAHSTEARVILNVSSKDRSDLRINYDNAAWVTLTGFRSEDVVGQSVMSLQVMKSGGLNMETQSAAVLEASREAILYPRSRRIYHSCLSPLRWEPI